jgi:hypothetical protein
MSRSSDQADTAGDLSRRQFLSLAAGIAAAPLLASSPANAADPAPAPGPKSARGPAKTGHNILFVFTDQQRYISKWPAGMSLPGLERLQRRGVSFENHYCPAVMCTSSRAVILTGLQTADNGMFENTDLPYMKSLSTDIPFHRYPDPRSHVAQGRLLHGLQGQVPPQQGNRRRRTGSPVHEGDGGLRLFRFRLARRRAGAHAGRIHPSRTTGA